VWHNDVKVTFAGFGVAVESVLTPNHYTSSSTLCTDWGIAIASIGLEASLKGSNPTGARNHRSRAVGDTTFVLVECRVRPRGPVVLPSHPSFAFEPRHFT